MKSAFSSLNVPDRLYAGDVFLGYLYPQPMCNASTFVAMPQFEELRDLFKEFLTNSLALEGSPQAARHEWVRMAIDALDLKVVYSDGTVQRYNCLIIDGNEVRYRL